MTFEQKRKLKNEYTPKYYKTFNVAALIPFLIWFLGGLAVVLALGLILDEHPAVYISLVVYLIGILVLTIVICVVSVKLRNRLLAERTQEVEAQYADMQLADAEAQLLEKAIITGYGFTSNRGQFAGQLVLPFNEAFANLHTANVYTKIVTVVQISDMRGNVIAEHVFDRTLYNFIFKKGIKVNFNGYNNLIVADKATFVKNYIMGDSEKRSMTFWFGMIGLLGTYLSEEGQNLNNSKNIVFNVLSSEIK